MSEVLERVRMCLAEDGYDPADAKICDLRGGIVIVLSRGGRDGWEERVPIEVAWRARNLAGDTSKCRTCYLDTRDFEGCVATTPLVEDCGVDRG